MADLGNLIFCAAIGAWSFRFGADTSNGRLCGWSDSLRAGGTPVVHLFRFPHVTINHGILLFAVTAANGELRFRAYDPNIPAHPVELIYRQADRTFEFPRNHYWVGGRLHVVEIYRNWIY